MQLTACSNAHHITEVQRAHLQDKKKHKTINMYVLHQPPARLAKVEKVQVSKSSALQFLKKTYRADLSLNYMIPHIKIRLSLT